jgi:hypothetical protein
MQARCTAGPGLRASGHHPGRGVGQASRANQRRLIMLKVALGTHGSLNVARSFVVTGSAPWPTEAAGASLQAVRGFEIALSYL